MRRTIIERAYDLAHEGQCRSIADIVATLKREQFAAVDAHISGASIKKSLNSIIKQAAAAAEADKTAKQVEPTG